MAPIKNASKRKAAPEFCSKVHVVYYLNEHRDSKVEIL
jgi:hypothetical protein